MKTLEDVFVDLSLGRELPGTACVFVKKSYVVSPAGGLEPGPVVPLVADRRGNSDVPSPLPQGCDLWAHRPQTDVVVLGSAHAPEGRAVREMRVACRVGQRTKTIAVFGRRFIEWSRDDRPRVGAPEAFTEMPLTREHAYGGIDPRVPVAPPETFEELLLLMGDHPGIYPRNPFGKGYFVVPERVDGIEMPNLEDPDDLLTAERLVVGDPRAWHRQPLPWSFDWFDVLMFPRYELLGAEPWFPLDEGVLLAEKTRGLFDDHRTVHQEASLGMCFAPLAPGTPIELSGTCKDGRPLSFALPAPPAVEIEVDGNMDRAAARPTVIVVRPDDRALEITYVATSKMPRTFIPGVHRHIPLSARIDGSRRIAYEPPQTAHDRLVAAGIRQPVPSSARQP